ncbi:hypothetical protein ACFXPI_12235 [Streptomyces sp. NPDC059104]|uniref:hypothetical protein n=1 Tax=Streptomyces sp. NPDC059104 TaxID=3346729 RepID=UPI003683F993
MTAAPSPTTWKSCSLTYPKRRAPGRSQRCGLRWPRPRMREPNDLGQASSLVPPSADALCRYGAEWTAKKLRWGLAVDELERDRLLDIAAGCGGTDVEFTPAPQRDAKQRPWSATLTGRRTAPLRFTALRDPTGKRGSATGASD